MRRHIRTAHSKKKNKIEKDQDVPCDFISCPKLFAKRSHMRNHYKQKHLLVKNQHCRICDAKFYRKHQLKVHMFDHTQEYPYKCERCEKGMITLKLYERHMSTHKTYECGFCPELKFDKWSQVIAHRREMHQPTCKICQKTFTTVDSKRSHMKTHQNVEDRKVFWCPYKPCAKFYYERRYVQGHIKRKHENIKFECDYCNEKLSTKQKLLDHMLKYHVTGERTLPEKGRRGTRKIKERRQGRYFFQKLSTAAVLTGLKTSAKVENLVVNDFGHNIEIHDAASFDSIHDEVAVIAVLPDGSEQSSTEN